MLALLALVVALTDLTGCGIATEAADVDGLALVESGAITDTDSEAVLAGGTPARCRCCCKDPVCEALILEGCGKLEGNDVDVECYNHG